MSRLASRTLLAFTVAAVLGPTLLAQQRPSLTAEDYARAERFLAAAVTPLVVGGSVTATWLADDRFWYRNTIAGGAEFILVDPVKKTRVRAFDHEKVAAALSSATGAKHEPLRPGDSGTRAVRRRGRGGVQPRRPPLELRHPGRKCAETGAAIGEVADPPAGGRGGRGGGRGGAGGRTSSDGKPLNMSPDGKRGVFIRDWNLWLHDVATRQERQVTTDGVKYFGYATDNAGWTSSDRAIALWSPDSKKIATQQQDEREVGELYFVNTVPGHPTLRVSKYPAARRQGHGHDPSRRHRRRRRPDASGCRCRPTSIAAPSATTSASATTTGAPTAPGWRSRLCRAITRRSRFALPTPRPARSARCSRKRWRRTTSRARAGRSCGRPTRSSGIPSATIGATFISTT